MLDEFDPRLPRFVDGSRLAEERAWRWPGCDTNKQRATGSANAILASCPCTRSTPICTKDASSDGGPGTGRVLTVELASAIVLVSGTSQLEGRSDELLGRADFEALFLGAAGSPAPAGFNQTSP